MALTSGRHPSLITSLLTEWAIWAAEKAATGPLPSWWPCPLGTAPARQPGRAGRSRHSSFTPPSWSQYSRCYDSSVVTKRQTQFCLFNAVGQSVLDSCVCGGWRVIVRANVWQSVVCSPVVLRKQCRKKCWSSCVHRIACNIYEKKLSPLYNIKSFGRFYPPFFTLAVTWVFVASTNAVHCWLW